MTTRAILALADGTVFKGHSIGVKGHSCGEIIFNTAMAGYQEVLTDPSYAKQLITFTYPHIGNVGMNPEDQEAEQIWAAGLVINEQSPIASNWRSTQSLTDYLQAKEVVGIAGVDTRYLTHLLREKGAQSACIMAGDNLDESIALAEARGFSGLQGQNLASEVSTKQSYSWEQGTAYPQVTQADFQHHLVAFDFGIKQNILRLFVDRGCQVTVVPANTPAAQVLALNPDGIFLSNGPGDPAACEAIIVTIKTLIEKKIPLFGICLGFQLLALALGAKTAKMKFGHHGANHPVQCLASQRVLITSQNHGFAVTEASLPDVCEVTHRSLFDGSLQGFRHTKQPLLGFQGHPEASPGPHDVQYLFDEFVESL